MTIVQFSTTDYRIRFQGVSSAYWHYSRPFSTRREAEQALEKIKGAKDV